MSRLVSAVAPTLIFVLLYLLTRALKADRWPVPWKSAASIFVALVLLVGAAYTALPILLEDTEANIASVTDLVMRGSPMYPAPEAAQRYLLLYGPLTYLGRLVFFPVLGVTLPAFKLAGFAAVAASLFFAYKIAHAYASSVTAWIGTGAFALLLFRFVAASIWGRCDPFLVCSAALGIWAALRGRWMITAIAMAALVDLKITGVCYCIPMLALLYVRAKALKAAAALSVAGVIALTPFLLPQVSLHNYWFALQGAGRHGLESDFLLRNLQYSWLLLLPILALLLWGCKPNAEQRVCLIALAFGLLLSSLVGAKIGAGSYHLLPHIAALLQLFFWIKGEHEAPLSLRRIALAWAASWLVFSVNDLREVRQGFASLPSAFAIESEIESVLAADPNRAVEIGVGDRYEDPRVRYSFVTTFHSKPYTLSYSALRDLQLSGVPVPASTLQNISSCSTPVWLIPKDQTPFAAPNTYFSIYRSPFDGIEPAFLKHYTKTQSLTQYDVWSCSNH